MNRRLVQLIRVACLTGFTAGIAVTGLPPAAHRAEAAVTATAQNAAPRALSIEDLWAMGRVSDPQFSPDGKRIAYVVTTYDLDANEGQSDIYAVAADGGEPRRLTTDPASDRQPRFSPDGRWLAFTSSRSGNSQIWLLPVAGGESTQLTDISTGASSPQWTPDGKTIVFLSSVFPGCDGDDDCNQDRLDAEKNAPSKARVIDHLLFRHWDHWRGQRRRHLFTIGVDANGKAAGPANDLTPGERDVPTEALGSGHDISISPDGTELCVVANTDPHPERSTNNDLFVFPITGGEWTRITRNPANDNHPVYSPDGRTIAYRAMARAGFEADRYALMLYDRKSGRARHAASRLAEELDRSVSSILWSPDSRRLYVRCADEGYVSIFTVDARGGKVARLTEGRYTSSLRVSPDGRRLAFVSQTSRRPAEVFTATSKAQRIAQLTHTNDARLAEIEMNDLEPFTFEGAAGATVHGWLLKPPGFDPAKKYPFVFLVHGGPQGAWGDMFHYRWNYQMFAAPGYVVAAVNPRGSTGYGQRFTDEISTDWGGKAYEDLMKGLDYVVASHPFIDTDRMASAGASYGGYMMNWFEGRATPFKCLVNHDGVYNLESMYGATEELWFPEWEFAGTPWESPELYKKWSPHEYAKNFKTPMLVVHGQLDYRVPLAEGLQVFTVLQRQGVPSKLLYFPDEGHWVLKPQNAKVWWETVYAWIDRWIGETR